MGHGHPTFQQLAPAISPESWVVFNGSPEDGTTLVVSGYYATNPGDLTGTTVAAVFDTTARKIVDGFVKRQVQTDDGWKEEMIRFDGTRKESPVQDQPEIIGQDAQGNPEIQHSYRACLSELFPYCSELRAECVRGCDGDSVCQGWCNLEYIACRLNVYIECIHSH